VERAYLLGVTAPELTVLIGGCVPSALTRWHARTVCSPQAGVLTPTSSSTARLSRVEGVGDRGDVYEGHDGLGALK